MAQRIVLIQGHPDPSPAHFGRALCDAYAEAALAAGHELRRVDLASLDVPLLRGRQEWESGAGAAPAPLQPAQEAIGWCSHAVLFFPLWLGDMPALVKAFLEQVLRPGFALGAAEGKGFPRKLLAGRSARVVVTMGMPALAYRWFYRAHSVKALERNVLGFVGFAPVNETLIGSVEGLTPAQRASWLERLRALGRDGR